MNHAQSSSRSDVRVRDARTHELDEIARLLAEVYGAFRGHLPDGASERYIGEIVDVRSRLGECELIVAEARRRGRHGARERVRPARTSARDERDRLHTAAHMVAARACTSDSAFAALPSSTSRSARYSPAGCCRPAKAGRRGLTDSTSRRS